MAQGWSPERIAQAAQPILGEAAATLTPGQLRQAATRIALTLDGDAAERRGRQIDRKGSSTWVRRSVVSGAHAPIWAPPTSPSLKRPSTSSVPAPIVMPLVGATSPGAAASTVWKEEPLLAYVFTASSHTGQGLGRRLIEAVMHALGEQGRTGCPWR
jgi:GNAT superfamily N-acetyltransferase